MRNSSDCISAKALEAVALHPQRCQFSSADGRRCRMPRWQAHPALCLTHARAQECGLDLEPTETLDLAPPSGEFRTATEVNRALGKVFCLLAQNRIPRRNAVALGYIAQLLLQTLPGVREEITQCLGYQAWTETLESVLCEEETENQAESDAESDASEEASEAEVASEGGLDVTPHLGTPISALAPHRAPAELNRIAEAQAGLTAAAESGAEDEGDSGNSETASEDQRALALADNLGAPISRLASCSPPQTIVTTPVHSDVPETSTVNTGTNSSDPATLPVPRSALVGFRPAWCRGPRRWAFRAGSDTR